MKNVNEYSFRTLFLLKYGKFLKKISTKQNSSFSNQVVRRIQQLVIEHSYFFCLKYANSLSLSKSIDFLSSNKEIDTGSLLINFAKGDVKVKVVTKCRKLLESVGFLFLAFYFVVRGCFSGNKSKTSRFNVVATDLGLHKFFKAEDIAEIHRAIVNDYFPLLNSSENLILRSLNFHNLKFGKVFFYKNHILGLLSVIRWEIRDVFLILLSYLRFFIFGILPSFFSDIKILLLKDRMMMEVMSHINKCNIVENFIITNSDCFSHDLYLSKFENSNHRLVMLWYSLNNLDFQFKRKFGNSWITVSPWVKFMNVDEHLVWNIEQEHWLRTLGEKAKISRSNPILFNNPYKTVSQNYFNPKKFNIILFDVPPKQKHIEDLVYGKSFIYCTLEICRQFILDFVEYARGKEVCVYLKTKRKDEKGTKSEYLQLIQDLENTNELGVIDPAISIFSLLDSKVDLVVCFPYTSVAYLASQRQIDSIFYDPGEMLDCNHIYYKDQIFISGKFELEKFLQDKVK